MKLLGIFFAVSGFLSVALGAFAAHGLKDRLEERLLAVFQTGVTYQFYHTLALGLVLVFWQQSGPSRPLQAAAAFFTAGILVFSGSLYALSLSGIRWLGAITPLGGVCFLIGWVLIGLHFSKSR